MQIKHLDHLNLTVSDLDASADWYRRVFGFRQVEDGIDDEHVRWAILKSGDALLCLYEHADRKFIQAGDRQQLNHFGFRIEDVAQWERTVAKESVPVRYGGAVHWPHSTAWYVADPTGWEIEVVHWRDDQVAFS